jgi:hypothetical protein
MHGQIAKPPVRVEFEMMMLKVRQAAAHLVFAGQDFPRPQCLFAAARCRPAFVKECSSECSLWLAAPRPLSLAPTFPLLKTTRQTAHKLLTKTLIAV